MQSIAQDLVRLKNLISDFPFDAAVAVKAAEESQKERYGRYWEDYRHHIKAAGIRALDECLNSYKKGAIKMGYPIDKVDKLFNKWVELVKDNNIESLSDTVKDALIKQYFSGPAVTESTAATSPISVATLATSPVHLPPMQVPAQPVMTADQLHRFWQEQGLTPEAIAKPDGDRHEPSPAPIPSQVQLGQLPTTSAPTLLPISKIDFAYVPRIGKKCLVENWGEVIPGQYHKEDNSGINLRKSRTKCGKYKLNVWDYDLKRNLTGEALTRMLDKYPLLRTTGWLETPSGGIHLWVLVPVDVNIKFAQKNWTEFDFLNNAQAVAPGSYYYKDGQRLSYSQLHNDNVVILTPEIIADFEQAGSYTLHLDPSIAVIVDDSDWIQMLFKEKYLDARGIVPEGKRNRIAFELACEAGDLGLSKEIAGILISEVIDLPEDELERTVASAYKNRQSPIGCKHPDVWWHGYDYDYKSLYETEEDIAESFGNSASESNPINNAEAKHADNNGPKKSTDNSSQWEQPESIVAPLPAVPQFDSNLLPAGFRKLAIDVAHSMQVPIDFGAVTIYIMLGAVIGAGCGIRPKARDNWLVIPNLYGMSVAPPGIMLKSPTFKAALAPLFRLEAEARSIYKAELAKYEREEIVYEASRAAIKSAMTSTAKKAITDTAKKKPSSKCNAKADNAQPETDNAKSEVDEPKDQSLDDLKKQLKELEPPIKPVRCRFITNDTTTEKLGELLGENPRGILVFRDELLGLLRSWEKAGHEQDRQFYLEVWNGYGHFTFDRIGRGTQEVMNMCVSLIGGIQPDKLCEYLYQMRKESDGMIPRFQLGVFPDRLPKWEYVDEKADKEAKDLAFNILERLVNMDFTKCGAIKEAGDNTPYFHFSEDAQKEFEKWYINLMQHKLRNSSDEPHIIEHLSKYGSLMPSLALIFHLTEIAASTLMTDLPSGNPFSPLVGPVSKEATLKAISMCDYLEAHARRIYSLVSNVANQAVSRLADKLKACKLTSPFTARDVQRHNWTLLNDIELITQACEELINKKWLKAVQQKSSTNGGRPTTYYYINPAVVGKSTN